MAVYFDKTYSLKQERSAGASLCADCNSKGYAGSKLGLDTLYLVALTDYNDQFHKNDTLNNIILVNDFAYTLNDLFRYQPVEYYVEENRTGVKREVFGIRISEPPSNPSGDYVFRLIYVLENGETFVKDSPRVALTR